MTFSKANNSPARGKVLGLARGDFLPVFFRAHVVEKIVNGVLKHAVEAHFVMKVGSGHEAGSAAFGDEIAAFNMLSFAHEYFGEVCVECLESEAVLHDHEDPVAAAAMAGHFHDAVARRVDRGADVIDDIKPFVGLENTQNRV